MGEIYCVKYNKQPVVSEFQVLPMEELCVQIIVKYVIREITLFEKIISRFVRYDSWNFNTWSTVNKILNALSTNFTKWSTTLKQFVGQLSANCLTILWGWLLKV